MKRSPIVVSQTLWVYWRAVSATRALNLLQNFVYLSEQGTNCESCQALDPDIEAVTFRYPLELCYRLDTFTHTYTEPPGASCRAEGK
jgi:hypothetical protein